MQPHAGGARQWPPGRCAANTWPVTTVTARSQGSPPANFLSRIEHGALCRPARAAAVGAGVPDACEDGRSRPEADVPGGGPPAPAPAAARSNPPRRLRFSGLAEDRAVSAPPPPPTPFPSPGLGAGHPFPATRVRPVPPPGRPAGSSRAHRPSYTRCWTAQRCRQAPPAPYPQRNSTRPVPGPARVRTLNAACQTDLAASGPRRCADPGSFVSADSSSPENKPLRRDALSATRRRGTRPTRPTARSGTLGDNGGPVLPSLLTKKLYRCGLKKRVCGLYIYLL